MMYSGSSWGDALSYAIMWSFWTVSYEGLNQEEARGIQILEVLLKHGCVKSELPPQRMYGGMTGKWERWFLEIVRADVDNARGWSLLTKQYLTTLYMIKK